ncbi:tRNA (adenosine(37)-N6)-threonylcarbamoyltransferase complex ATPase subunit type 1 TsaE [Pelagibacterium lacus]|uniref:tRNA threonylcarbamoyladenosine biosynthesis protein TsaE n=1 Tax=Pelagibacterium lacus TaxID=2282655 RepID=A0A369W3X9_9HYPH|nr:tRNA (adenosine(37)-N6)-threonylcarbamoyltransferase complex ATPase subunit type 1 TsaE [Pelagibacterium lacus]
MLTAFAPDDAATAAIGTALAAVLRPGDVVALDGGLGAGKTALARAIIRARLGAPDLEVPSPTFAIVQPYPGILHADLYRLADESEIFELGLFDDDDVILLVEWPQRAPILFDRDGLKLTLDMGEDGAGRVLSVKPMGHRDMAPVATALAPWLRTR